MKPIPPEESEKYIELLCEYRSLKEAMYASIARMNMAIASLQDDYGCFPEEKMAELNKKWIVLMDLEMVCDRIVDAFDPEPMSTVYASPDMWGPPEMDEFPAFIG